MNKKAALKPAITVIVVLIITITVLGLGMVFIKKQFAVPYSDPGLRTEPAKIQLEEQVRTGRELLVFSMPEEASIGKPVNTLIGVHNTAANPEGEKVCFRVEVKCKKPFTPQAFCDPSTNENDIAVGGYDTANNDFVVGGHYTANNDFVLNNRNWFKSILGQFDLKNFEGDVYDAILLVRGVKPDNYQMEINVYKEPNDKACKDQGFADPAKELYASKKFILNVV